MKRLFIVGLTISVVGFGLYGWSHRGRLRDELDQAQRPALPRAVSIQQMHEQVKTTSTKRALKPIAPATPQTATSTAATAFPREVNLSIPFLLQAPKQNWAMPYQEACEEASMLMVKSALEGVQRFTPDEGDALILDILAKEDAEHLPPDMTVAQAKTFFETAYPAYRVTVIHGVTENALKSWLARGVPVIIPASGKELQNPNFHNGGPPYHMLVVKGYLADGRWITNDPGTRKGADYLYEKETLLNAIHDWNGGDVVHGSSAAFVIQAK